MSQLVSVGYGKLSFSTQSLSLSSTSISEPFLRSLPGKTFNKKGKTQMFPASLHPQINGSLFLDSVEIPDGTILCIQLSGRSRGAPVRDGAIFLCTRSTGPFLTIQARIPSSVESVIGSSFLTFQGRADLVQPDTLRSAYGLDPSRNWLDGFTDPEEVGECFVIETVSPQTAPAPVGLERIETATGEVVLVQKRAGRNLRIRRA